MSKAGEPILLHPQRVYLADTSFNSRHIGIRHVKDSRLVGLLEAAKTSEDWVHMHEGRG